MSLVLFSLYIYCFGFGFVWGVFFLVFVGFFLENFCCSHKFSFSNMFCYKLLVSSSINLCAWQL